MSSLQDSPSVTLNESRTTLTNRKPHRVLITDSDYKHSIALARYIKRELKDVYLIGQSTAGGQWARHYSCFDELYTNESLEKTLSKGGFDQVIPVGAASTLQVARLRPDLAVLSSPKQLETCFDKRLTIDVANRVEVPVPVTQMIEDVDQINVDKASFPCVVKADREIAVSKSVRYCQDAKELRTIAKYMLDQNRSAGVGILVQELITGPGHGFFALMDHGKPLRIFMHKRLREFPPTGGASTAAAAFYSPRLEELGLKLLSHLCWNGVAMVEFKFDLKKQDFVLMEVNGKFWGSLELALCSGVNFGADLVHLFRGDKLEPSSVFDQNVHFYWPLDGDLVTLRQSGHLIAGIYDYFRGDSATNLGQSASAEMIKCVRLIRDVLRGNKA